MSDSFTDVSRYAPAFTIKIKGQDLSSDAFKLVSKITVSKELRKPDRFSFEMQDEMKEGKLQWVGHSNFTTGNDISITLGYSGNLVQKVEGIITDVSGQFTQSVASSFTVSGEDKGYRKLTGNSKPVVWQKKKDSEIVSAIASEVGLSTTVDATSIQFPERKKKGDTSYFHYIDSLAGKNASYEFMISEGKLIFRKAKISSSAVVTINWGVEITEIKPVMNLSQMVTEVQVKSWDQKQKKLIMGSATAGQEPNQEGSNTLGTSKAKTAYGEILKVINEIPVETVEEAKEVALAHLVEIGNQFIKANITCIGIPEIMPGVCVEVKGVGANFEGKYYVEKSVHTISKDGYTTEFDGRRNSVK